MLAEEKTCLCIDCLNFKTRIINPETADFITKYSMTKPLAKKLEENEQGRVWYCCKSMLRHEVIVTRGVAEKISNPMCEQRETDD